MPNVKRFIPMLLAATTVSLAAAGCGGGDESAPAPAPVEQPAEPAALTKDELISQGDGICAEVNAAVGTIDGSTIIAESDKLKQKGDLYAGLADRLEELGTPSDGEAPTEVIAALRGDPGAESGVDLAAFQEAATAYGFTECAEAPVAPVPESAGAESPAGTESTDSSPGGESTYTEPAPPAPAPAPAPAPSETGGVNPDAGSGTGGTGGGGGGGSSGGSSGGIGPG